MVSVLTVLVQNMLEPQVRFLKWFIGILEITTNSKKTSAYDLSKQDQLTVEYLDSSQAQIDIRCGR